VEAPMIAKAIAAVALIAIAAVASRGWIGARRVVVHPGGQDVVLVPAALDGASMLKRWRNQRSGTIVEVGALYAASHFGPAPVLLDFRRGDPRTHNGIGCFLGQGETLDSERLHTLTTAYGTAVFDVGILRTPDQVRLIAATECTADQCVEEKLPMLDQFWHQWDLKHLMTQTAGSVVPVAVILTRKTGGYSADDIVAALEDELRHVAAVLDLRPARRLAAVQAGRSDPAALASDKAPMPAEDANPSKGKR